MARYSIVLAAALMLAVAAPAMAHDGDNGEGGKGDTHGAGSRFGLSGGGVQYSTSSNREPSKQPTGSVAGNTGVGVCGCH